jgi:hypothetical protein
VQMAPAWQQERFGGHDHSFSQNPLTIGAQC